MAETFGRAGRAVIAQGERLPADNPIVLKLPAAFEPVESD
jgi:hypothetical protein